MHRRNRNSQLIHIPSAPQVKECNFIEDFEILESSDIEAFYAVYSQHAQAELPIKHSSPSSMGPLQIFLRGMFYTSLLKISLYMNIIVYFAEICPEFKPHFDSEGRIVPSDYIYVYTLLMHYTCVQNPRKYFHDICTKLPKSVQGGIAAFFQQTVNLPQLTRHHLRETIINVRIDTENSTDDDIEPLSEINSVNSTPLDIKTIDTTDSTRTSSLSKKWIKPMATSPIVTPPTPKTELLEQKTRELRGLRVNRNLGYYNDIIMLINTLYIFRLNWKRSDMRKLC